MEVIPNILLAIGTLALAIVAFYSLRQNQKQIQVLSRQVNVQKSLLVPYLQVKQLDIQGNRVSIETENVSDTTAHWFGLATEFYLVYPRYSADPKGDELLSPSHLEQLIEEGKTVWVEFLLLSSSKAPRFTYEGKLVLPEGVVTYPESGFTATVFAAHTSTKVEIEPLFCVHTEKKTLGSGFGKAFRFPEFREFLLQNEVGYVAVNLSLVYKDVTETPIGHESVAKFVVNAKEHKTIQESWQSKHSFHFLPLSIGEIQRDIKWLSLDSYRQLKSHWNLPEEAKEKLEKL